MEVKRSFLTVRNILRVLALLSIVFVFCPSFLVSCSGQTVNISVLTAIEGVSAYGEKLVEPHPIMILCIVFPVFSFTALFLKSITKRRAVSMVFTFMAVDTFAWYNFRSTVRDIAYENQCAFNTTTWFVFNIIVHFLLMMISALVFANIIQMDADLTATSTSDETKDALKHVLNSTTQFVDRASGSLKNNESQKDTAQCPNCGTIVIEGSKFCNVCGSPIPESVFNKDSETEQVKGEQKLNKIMYCPNCGTRIEPEAIFCICCGTKIK